MYTTMPDTFIQASIRAVCPLLLAPKYGITCIAFGWPLMLLFEVPYYFFTCQKR